MTGLLRGFTLGSPHWTIPLSSTVHIVPARIMQLLEWCELNHASILGARSPIGSFASNSDFLIFNWIFNRNNNNVFFYQKYGFIEISFFLIFIYLNKTKYQIFFLIRLTYLLIQHIVKLKSYMHKRFFYQFYHFYKG